MLGTFYNDYWFSRPRPATRGERLRSSMSGRINRLPFANHPGFKWGDRGRYEDDTFGGRAGPNLGATVIMHDIAHAIEFGADNFAKRYWNGSFYFKTPRARYIGDRYAGLIYDDPKDSTGTRRECMAFGIQWHLMQMAGYKVSRDVFVKYAVQDNLEELPDSFASTREEKIDWVESAIEAWDDRELLLSRINAWLDKSLAASKRRKKKSITPLSLGARPVA